MKLHPKATPEIGNRYGKLTVTELAPYSLGCGTRWLCTCDCGTKLARPVPGGQLRAGKVLSCGCAHLPRGKPPSHGMSAHPAYAAYSAAKSRCTNVYGDSWENYGGRGIRFELPPFPEFWSVMQATWFKGATLDRTDNDGPYSMSNVRWATRKEQANNKRDRAAVAATVTTPRRVRLPEWLRPWSSND